MADKSLSTIAQELWQGFGRNPRNTETFEALANMIPVGFGTYRGAKTLSNIDIEPLKQAYLNEAYGRNDPRVNQAAGRQLGNIAMGTLDVLPAVPLVKAGLKQAAPYVAEAGARQMAAMSEKYGLPSLTPTIVPPEGNLNLRPAIEEAKIKGPEKQRAGDMLRQLKNKPGITKEALQEIRESIGDANKVMTKKEFESHVKASQYSKEDLKQASLGDIEHYLDEAMEQMTPHDAMDTLGVPKRYQNDALMLEYGDIEFHELDPASQIVLGQLYGIDSTMSPDDIRYGIEQINMDAWHEAMYDRAEVLRAEGADDVANLPYPYEGVQRLVHSQPKDSYFEFGVTHPEQREEYRHYRSEHAPEGLIGHVRGSHLIDPSAIQGGIETLPNSYIVEEIQSDAQKIADQKGHLRQVHGTLAKAAIQDAIERGADRIYFPTSYPIAKARGRSNEEYAAIYDQAVHKEALQPISEKYGVQLTPVNGYYPVNNSKIVRVPGYHTLELTPEFKRQFELEGFQTPGYKKGGEVDTLKATPRNQFMYNTADKSLFDIAKELYQGFGNNPANRELANTLTFRAPIVRELNPFVTVPRGINTLRNTDYSALKDLLLAKYQIADNPRASLQRSGEALMKVGEGVLDAAPVLGLVKPTIAGAKMAAPHLAQAGMRQLEGMVEKYGLPSLTPSIIKQEGPSNWLPGSVEVNTQRLKQLPTRPINADWSLKLDPSLPTFDPEMRRIWDEMHTMKHSAVLPSEQSVFLQRYYPERLADFGFTYTPEANALNTFIDKRLNKYIRNEMATESDPLRAMAEEGRLHFDPDELTMSEQANVAIRRHNAGFPAGGSAESNLARRWELMADKAIEGKPVSEWEAKADPEVLAKMPWMEHLGPGDLIFERTDPSLNYNLGFRHLTDELKNSMDATTDLPQHLRLKPKQVEQMTVENAAEHVAKINDWRAAQAAKAEMEGLQGNLAGNARHIDETFAPSFANEQGGKWVDIPDTRDEAGLQYCTTIGKAGGWCTQGEGMANRYGSGDTRLTALLDADGRPHAQATIYESPVLPRWEDVQQYIPESLQEAAVKMPSSTPDEINAYANQLAAQKAKQAMPKDITELKPVGNSLSSDRAQTYAKRDPEYKNKISQSVVNFLNSGNWGKVPKNDLRHLDIVDLQEPGHALSAWADHRIERGPENSLDYDAFNLAIEHATENTPRFMTQQQFKEFLAPFTDQTPHLAAGGLVTSDFDEDHIDQLADHVLNFEEGGLVDKVARWGRKGQYKIAKAIGIGPEVEFATEIPERYYPANEQHNARGDAMRHMLLQAQLANRSPMLAKAVGWAHENLSGPQGDAEKAMDEYNDMIGRQIGVQAKDKADMVWQALQAIDSRKAKTLNKDQMEQGYAEGGLVYNDAHIDRLADQLFGV